MMQSTKAAFLVMVVLTFASVTVAVVQRTAQDSEYISYESAGSDNSERYDVIRPAERLQSYRKQALLAQAEGNAYPAPAQIQKHVSIGEEYNHPAPAGIRKPVPSEERLYQAPPARKSANDYSYSAPAPVAPPAPRKSAPVVTDYSYSAPAAPSTPRKSAPSSSSDYSYPAPAAPSAPRKSTPVTTEYSYSAPAPAAPAPRKPASDSYYSAPRKSAEEAREDERLTQEQNSNAHYSFASAVNDGIQDQSQVRKETRDGLKVSGEYSYSDGNVRRTVKYEADENGYRVVSETQEDIEGGPQVDLVNGKADVHTQLEGVDTVYSISAQDILPKEPLASAPQVAKPKSHLRHKEAESWEE